MGTARLVLCLRRAALLCVLCVALYGSAHCRSHLPPDKCLQEKAVTDTPLRERRACGDSTCWCSDGMAFCRSPAGPVRVPVLPEDIGLLHLAWDYGKSDLDNWTFANVSSITQLSLSYNGAPEIPEGALDWLQNLTCLNIDHNVFDVGDFLYLLSVPSLKYVSARKVGDLLDRVPVLDMFGMINASSVETLVLSPIKTTSPVVLDLTVFCSFPRLRHLEVIRSDVFFVTYGGVKVRNETECLSNLTALHLQENVLIHIPITCLGYSLAPSLEYLNLSRNNIGPSPYHYIDFNVCLPSLKLLDLSVNGIYNFSYDLFTWHVDHPFTLILDRQTPFCTCSCCTLHDLALADTKYSGLSLAANNIDFSDTGAVSDSAFGNNTALQRLVLDDNDFFGVDDDRFVRLFSGLRALRSLSMSRCHLYGVSLESMAIFPLLSELVLADNGFVHIPDGVFSPLQQLSVVDVSRNKLETVSEDTFSPDTRRRLTGVYLSSNPFQCSCDLLWFRDWLVANPSLFHPPHGASGSYDCSNHHNVPVSAYVPPQQACLLSREVSTHIILSCSFVLTVLTAASLFYRYRWHLRLLLYEAFRGRGDVRQQRLQNGHFDYDLFVSYCGPQLPWVQQHLLPHLEERQGLRLCLHERDFIPGRNIVDNIVDCVHSSKKVLMVFSRHFVLSQWCQFELAFCLKHVMDYDDALIVVCVDDVASRQMTPAMMAVLKTTTYLQWGEGEEVARAFWTRLRQALAEVVEQTP